VPSLVIVLSAVLILFCGQTETETHRITHTERNAANLIIPATTVRVRKHVNGNSNHKQCYYPPPHRLNANVVLLVFHCHIRE